jgi:hypothetical protein
VWAFRRSVRDVAAQSGENCSAHWVPTHVGNARRGQPKKLRDGTIDGSRERYTISPSGATRSHAAFL